MPLLTVTNLTNSPFDLEGGIRLPAMGEVTDAFSADYGELLRISPGLQVAAADETQAIDPLDHDGDGKPGGSLKGEQSTATKGRRRRSMK